MLGYRTRPRVASLSSDGRPAISGRLEENDGAVTRIVRPGKPRCHQRPIEGLLPKRSAANAKCFPLSPADRSPGFLGSRLKKCLETCSSTEF